MVPPATGGIRATSSSSFTGVAGPARSPFTQVCAVEQGPGEGRAEAGGGVGHDFCDRRRRGPRRTPCRQPRAGWRRGAAGPSADLRRGRRRPPGAARRLEGQPCGRAVPVRCRRSSRLPSRCRRSGYRVPPSLGGSRPPRRRRPTQSASTKVNSNDAWARLSSSVRAIGSSSSSSPFAVEVDAHPHPEGGVGVEGGVELEVHAGGGARREQVAHQQHPPRRAALVERAVPGTRPRAASPRPPSPPSRRLPGPRPRARRATPSPR